VLKEKCQVLLKRVLFPLEIKKKILREKSGELIANLETFPKFEKS